MFRTPNLMLRRKIFDQILMRKMILYFRNPYIQNDIIIRLKFEKTLKILSLFHRNGIRIVQRSQHYHNFVQPHAQLILCERYNSSIKYVMLEQLTLYRFYALLNFFKECKFLRSNFVFFPDPNSFKTLIF